MHAPCHMPRAGLAAGTTYTSLGVLLRLFDRTEDVRVLWQGCSPAWRRLQPYVLAEAATLGGWRLSPYMTEAVTLCVGGCNPM